MRAFVGGGGGVALGIMEDAGSDLPVVLSPMPMEDVEQDVE